MNKDKDKDAMQERLEQVLDEIMDHDGGVKTLKSRGFEVVASVHILATGVTYLTSPEFPGFVVTCEDDLGPMLGGNVPFLDILVIGKDKCPGKHGHWEGYDNLVALFNNAGGSLLYVPDEYRTYDLCKIAVKMDSWNMRHVPHKFKDSCEGHDK